MSATANNSKKSMSKVPDCMTPSFNPLELAAGARSHPCSTPEYACQCFMGQREGALWHRVLCDSSKPKEPF